MTIDCFQLVSFNDELKKFAPFTAHSHTKPSPPVHDIHVL